MPTPATPSPPQCLSMLICDSMYLEPTTRKATLLGVMSFLNAAAVPFAYRPFGVHFVVTRLSGTYEVRLLIRHESTGNVISRTKERQEVVKCDDPTGEINGLIQVEGVTFPLAGSYRFSLLMNGVTIAERRLEIRLPPKPPAAPRPSTPEP